MKNQFYEFVASSLIAYLVVGLACTTDAGQNSTTNLFLPASEPEQTRLDSRSVEFQGVSLSYNSALETQIVPELANAVPLGKKDDKPDMARPKHIVFHLKGAYGDLFKDAFFAPEIHIYPIDGYRDILRSASSELVAFNKRLSDLHDILYKKHTERPSRVPFVEFLDAEAAFFAKVKYAGFKNGRGVWYLTQFNIERSLINNQGLTYVFQGLTDDNKYYISASFPVSSPLLAKSYEDTNAKNYTLPEYSYTDDEAENRRNAEEYMRYVKEISAVLETSSVSSFQPKLNYFEEIIGSLMVQPPRVRKD